MIDSIPPMSPLDVNAPSVMGLDAATAAAIDLWHQMGEPMPARYGEDMRQSLLTWAPGSEFYTPAIYQAAVYCIQEGRFARAIHERDAAWKRRREADRARKESLAHQMKVLREAMHLTQDEVAGLINEKPTVIREIEGRAGSSFATARVAEVLSKYQAHAKVFTGRPAKAKAGTAPAAAQ